MALALIDAGAATFPLGPHDPFPGGMFVNATRFLDYMTPPLASAWRAKLLGDGSGGRAGWDVADTLQGNWYRADVTDPTLDNIFAAEENAVSFSPYNLDPAHQTIIGVGENFFAHILAWPAPPPPPSSTLIDTARTRLAHGLRFAPDRVTPGTHHNPDPPAVLTSEYACYDVPDPLGDPGHPSPLHGLLVYLPIVDGTVHLKLRYVPAQCTTLLTNISSSPDPTGLLAGMPWWGDYVR
jgi:hypothetical protein